MSKNIGNAVTNMWGKEAGGTVTGFGDALTGKDMQRAADAQIAAGDRALAEQRRQYDQTRADNEPWRQAGVGAIGDMQGRDFQRDFTMGDFQADPGYQFRMNEGMKAIQGSAAAKGSLNSGATLKSLMRFGQDTAAQEYQNSYDRFNADRDRRFNRLASLSGMGQTAQGQVGAAGQNYSNNASEIMMGQGNARAGAIVGRGNWFRQNHQQGMEMMGNMGGMMMASDERVKTNVLPFDANRFLKPLKAVSFDYIDPKFGVGQHHGVMAQALEASPEGASFVTEVNGVKMVDYGKMIPALLASIAALKQEIDKLKGGEPCR